MHGHPAPLPTPLPVPLPSPFPVPLPTPLPAPLPTPLPASIPTPLPVSVPTPPCLLFQVHPCEAQVATLPHYLHPSLPLETSEVRAQYRNPYQVVVDNKILLTILKAVFYLIADSLFYADINSFLPKHFLTDFFLKLSSKVGFVIKRAN